MSIHVNYYRHDMAQPEHLGRKRPRNKCDEGGCDFMPLSKRINNLHLDRPADGQSGPSFTPASMQNGFQLENGTYENGNSHQWGQPESNGHEGGGAYLAEQLQVAQSPLVPSDQPGTIPNTANLPPWVSQQMMAQYAPVLEPTDNPHYYESNKVLFALFMERMRRMNQM